MLYFEIFARGIKSSGLWKAFLNYKGRTETKTLPVGATADDFGRQINPDNDFQETAPPPELRRVFTVSGTFQDIYDPEIGETVRTWVYNETTSAPWPIDALNYPASPEAIDTILDNVTTLAALVAVVRIIAKMVFYLYQDSK